MHGEEKGVFPNYVDTQTSLSVSTLEIIGGREEERALTILLTRFCRGAGGGASGKPSLPCRD